VASWLARADLESAITTFIQFAHARINRDLRVAAMLTTATGTVSSNTITLPTDCRKVQSVIVSDREIHPLPPESLQDATAGAPVLGYVVIGDVLQIVGGSGDEDYSLTYFQALPDPADEVSWLLVREPALYLYAALIEASPYLQDDERVMICVSQYKTILDQIHAEDVGIRYGNAPTALLRGATP